MDLRRPTIWHVRWWIRRLVTPIWRPVDEVLERCDVCRSFAKAPHDPIAGASTVSMFNGKAQAGLPFLGDIIALRAMDMFSKYSFLLPVQSENPQEAGDVLRGGWLGALWST